MAKVKKYIKAIQSGKTKEQSKIIAGYSPTTTTTDIEKTKDFKDIQIKLADKLEVAITKQEVANKLADNIRQTESYSSSNQAIDLFHKITEPDGTQEQEQDKVIIVIQKNDININPPISKPLEAQLDPSNVEEGVIIDPKQSKDT